MNPSVSGGFLRVFSAYTRRYLRSHFHGFRIAHGGLPAPDLSGPIVIFLNHAAWWDPLVCLHLSREFFPDRTSFAPIDASMLERYGFFRRLGFYGVEQGSTRGARSFLETTRSLLSSEKNAVWLTPQGRFTDVRERPIRLRRGLGALAAHAGPVTFVPLAIEYAFWTEPRPEILVAFGTPIRAGEGTADEWTTRCTAALEKTQDDLATLALRRDTADWRELNPGRSGISATYDLWRWFRARCRGESFSPAHSPGVSR